MLQSVQKDLDEAVTKIGRDVSGIQGDIANLADLDRLYAQVKTEKGHIDTGRGLVSYQNAIPDHFRFARNPPRMDTKCGDLNRSRKVCLVLPASLRAEPVGL